MNYFRLILIFLTIPFINSCDDENYPDCVCSEEFRMYYVIVIDTLGNPVDSLQTTVTNEKGTEYTFNGFLPPPYLQGAYLVMTDGYQNDFGTRPVKIFFSRIKNDLEVGGEYLFNTDKCFCHVYKLAGPDTLVLK